MIRSGGIAIETVSEQDLIKIKNCKLFEKSGLKIDAPRKIGPKIIMYDVPEDITNVELIRDLYARNLTGILNANEMVERVRIITRGEKGGNRNNVIIELPGKAWKHLLNAGRVYIGWNSFKINEFEVVSRCYGCYGYGHRLKECKKEGRVCRNCGKMRHIQTECTAESQSCINCKERKSKHDHDVMSTECPEYQRALQRLRATIHYG